MLETSESRMSVMFLKHWVSTSVTLECLSRMCLRLFNMKTLNGRLIAHKFNTAWAAGVVESVEKNKSVAGQFEVEYKSETYCWTQKLNREDYGVGKYWVLLAVVKE